MIDSQPISTTLIKSPKPKQSAFEAFRSSKEAILFVCSLALFTDMLVYGIVIPILPPILRSIGVEADHQTTYSTILFSAYAFGLFIATPIFGILSDKTGNRKIPMLLGLAGLALTTIIFAISSNFYSLLIARFLQGIAGAASWVVGMALIADSYPLSQLGSAMGFVMSFNTVGFICGPVISGYAATYFSLRAPFYICALFAAIDFIARLIVKPPKNNNSKSEQVSLSSSSVKLTMIKKLLFSEIVDIFAHWEIAILCFGEVLGSISFSIVEALIAEYLEVSFNLSISECSTTLLYFILPNAFFSIIIGKMTDKYRRTRLIIIGTLLHAISSPFIALARTLFEFKLAAIAFGLTSSFMMTPVMPQMTFLVGSYGKHNSSYGKLYSIYTIAYSLGMVVGPILAGFLKSSFSFLAAMSLFPVLSCFIFIPLFTVISVFKERNRYRLSELSGNISRPSFFKELFFPVPEPVYSKYTSEVSSIVLPPKCNSEASSLN